MNHSNAREYKDRFFRYLFGNPDYKEFTLSLYNALNGTDYRNPNDLQFNTLENVFFVGMKNDVSFVICDEINVWEQQSSWNENIPLRELIYYVELIQKRINGVPEYLGHVKSEGIARKCVELCKKYGWDVDVCRNIIKSFKMV